MGAKSPKSPGQTKQGAVRGKMGKAPKSVGPIDMKTLGSMKDRLSKMG